MDELAGGCNNLAESSLRQEQVPKTRNNNNLPAHSGGLADSLSRSIRPVAGQQMNKSVRRVIVFLAWPRRISLAALIWCLHHHHHHQHHQSHETDRLGAKPRTTRDFVSSQPVKEEDGQLLSSLDSHDLGERSRQRRSRQGRTVVAAIDRLKTWLFGRVCSAFPGLMSGRRRPRAAVACRKPSGGGKPTRTMHYIQIRCPPTRSLGGDSAKLFRKNHLVQRAQWPASQVSWRALSGALATFCSLIGRD